MRTIRSWIPPDPATLPRFVGPCSGMSRRKHEAGLHRRRREPERGALHRVLGEHVRAIGERAVRGEGIEARTVG